MASGVPKLLRPIWKHRDNLRTMPLRMGKNMQGVLKCLQALQIFQNALRVFALPVSVY